VLYDEISSIVGSAIRTVRWSVLLNNELLYLIDAMPSVRTLDYRHNDELHEALKTLIGGR